MGSNGIINIWKPWWFFIVFFSNIGNPKDFFLVQRNSFRLVLDLSLSEHVVLACKLDHPKDNSFLVISYTVHIYIYREREKQNQSMVAGC